MKKIIFPIALIGFIFIIFLIIRPQVNAAAQSSNIASRIKGLGVPVIDVKTTNLLPYKIEIFIQSKSENQDFSYDDFWNIALAAHVAETNFRIGTRVSSYEIAGINTKGETIGPIETNLDPNNANQELPFGIPKLDNTQTESLIKGKLNLGTLTLDKLNVLSINASEDTGQILDIQLSAKDAVDAYNSLSIFSPSLDQFLSTSGNTQFGIYIVLYHLRIVDHQGNILGDLVQDLESGRVIGKGTGTGPLGGVGVMQTPSLPTLQNSGTEPVYTPINSTSSPSPTIIPTIQALTGYPPPPTATSHPYP